MKNVLQKEMRFAMNITRGGGTGTLDPDKPGGGDDGSEDSTGKK